MYVHVVSFFFFFEQAAVFAFNIHGIKVKKFVHNVKR
jgi:hypothetical protein